MAGTALPPFRGRMKSGAFAKRRQLNLFDVIDDGILRHDL
jgi:hypothetical protein